MGEEMVSSIISCFITVYSALTVAVLMNAHTQGWTGDVLSPTESSYLASKNNYKWSKLRKKNTSDIMINTSIWIGN